MSGSEVLSDMLEEGKVSQEWYDFMRDHTEELARAFTTIKRKKLPIESIVEEFKKELAVA